MSVLEFFQWCEGSPIGTMIRESTWAFAAIESVHLLALALIGGSVLLLDLRMLGFGLQQQPVAEIASESRPWFSVSLAVMIVSGMLLFLSEATKCYYSTPFWVKMTCLSLVTIYSYLVWYPLAGADEGRGSLSRKAAAIVSLALWFGVGSGGRWIGFSG